MVRLALHSIAYEAKTLNLAKSGYTAFYVDAAIGSDTHDGGSWAQAFKTIQHAIDEAGSWCKIFIKDGTYVENVVVTNTATSLIGESKTGTIIHPTSGTAVQLTGDYCGVSDLTVYTDETLISPAALHVDGDSCDIDRIVVDTAMGGCGIRIGGMWNKLCEITIDNSRTVYGCIFLPGADFSELYDSYFNMTYNPGVYSAWIVAISGSRARIHNNTFNRGQLGIWETGAPTEVNVAYHNNFVNIQYPAHTAHCKYFENYYSDHTNVDNGWGIAVQPYKYSGVVRDPAPVIIFDGWKRTSLGRVVLASGSNTLNDANPSDAIIPLSLPTNMHTVLDISNLNNNLDDFTLEVKVGAAASERVVAYYKLTSDGSDITIDTGSGVGAVRKQRKIDISNILVYTGEQVLLNYTKNGATDRDVTYKYVCGG